MIYKIATNKKIEIFDNIASVAGLVIASSRRQNLEAKETQLIMMITKWMHSIAIMLDKEKNFDDDDDEVRNTIKQALDFTVKCFDD